MVLKHIMIVTDGTDGAAAMTATLESAGYLTIGVRDGVDALRHFAGSVPIDAVLLDTTLKSGSGLMLLENFKGIQPDAPVIMVSAISDIGTVVSAVKKGAFDYLQKPVDGAKLLDTVRRAIEQREHSQQDKLHRENLERVVEARTEMLRRAIDDLERSYDITLEALGNALDLKDTETEGHSKRVTAYAIVLARAMNLHPAEVKIIARGAFLHDIGKMAIPDAILGKPGKLTPEEQSVMREHCARGYAILRKIPFLEPAAEIVLSHQEHYDGSGYSRGLKGEQIPLGARIFSVADALDAITSDRPYRKARSFTEARREIHRCRGTQFDPAIVAVYDSLPDVLWEELRSEINHPRGVSPSDLTEVLTAPGG